AVVGRRRAGERVGIKQCCALVERVLRGHEMPILDTMVFTGLGRPGEDCFGTQFGTQTVEVPVLDVGFHPSTFVTQRVQGLVPGSAADRAGLREGETIELPTYSEMVRMNVGHDLAIHVTR